MGNNRDETLSAWKQYKSLSINGTEKSLHGWRAQAQQQLQEGYGIHDIRQILEFVVDWSNTKEWIPARTSGSTGRPKNIKIKKDQIVESALRTLSFLNLEKGDGALLCLPNKFIGGKMMIARSIIGGLDLHIAEDFSRPDIPEGVDIAFAALVPYQLHAILKDDQLSEKWKRVKKIIVGGGHVDKALEAKLKDWPNDVYESFGMTETISHVALRRISGEKVRQPFRALPGIRLEVDERNCLIIHSETLPTNPTITNDLIELVDESAFHWLGRVDNLINSGGIKIIPEQVEKHLRPMINTRFFVAGIPDEQLGEKCVLIVEGQPYSDSDHAELLNDFKEMLGKYEAPKEILYAEAFVETENGKINRKKTLKKVLKSA